MSAATVIVILVIALVIILVLRAGGESRAQDPLAEYQAKHAGSSAQPDVRRVVQLLMEGKRIEAIKAYMEVAGVGLEEAKSAIERYDPLMDKFGVRNVPAPLSDWTEIDEHLRNGSIIEAIKIYRQKTGAGLKDAKDAVEARDEEID